MDGWVIMCPSTVEPACAGCPLQRNTKTLCQPAATHTPQPQAPPTPPPTPPADLPVVEDVLHHEHVDGAVPVGGGGRPAPRAALLGLGGGGGLDRYGVYARHLGGGLGVGGGRCCYGLVGWEWLMSWLVSGFVSWFVGLG